MKIDKIISNVKERLALDFEINLCASIFSKEKNFLPNVIKIVVSEILYDYPQMFVVELSQDNADISFVTVDCCKNAIIAGIISEACLLIGEYDKATIYNNKYKKYIKTSIKHWK